jgi:hypothetical protein
VKILAHSAAALVILAGCAQPPASAAPQDARFPTILEAPPRLPITRLGPETYKPTLEDRRFLFSREVESRHLPLLRRIKSGEMGNFGGVDWRWRDGPENGGLGRLSGTVFFLRAPAATLARYTRDPLFEAATADFARTRQDEVAEGWAKRIGRELASAEYGNMTVPRLRVMLPKPEFEARARAEGWRLPANLSLWFDPQATPDLPAVAPDVAASIRAFPQELRPSGPVPDMATYDAIVLRDGCLVIDEEGDDDPLAEFPLGIGLFRDAEGHLSFRSRYSERPRTLGRVGTRLQLGWRTGPRPAPAALAKACKASKIVTVTSVDQAAGYGGQWFAVREYRDRQRLTSAEAMSRANACLLGRERRLTDARLGRPVTSSDAFCPSDPTAPPPPPPPARSSG